MVTVQQLEATPIKDIMTQWNDDCFDDELWGCFMNKLKHSVIGSAAQKDNVFTHNYIPKLLSLIKNGNLPASVRCDAVVVVGSLAVRNTNHVRRLIDCGTISALLDGLKEADPSFIEACLRALETILSAKIASVEEIYKDDDTVETFIKSAKKSQRAHESLGYVIIKTCQEKRQQDLLHSHGIVDIFAPLLFNTALQIKTICLDVLSTICFDNVATSEAVARASHMGIPLLDQIKRILSHEIELDVRLAAAKCLTYLAKMDAIPMNDVFISKQVMPLLVRCCKFENNILVCTKRRATACETLAYLIENDLNLQYFTSWNNTCLKTLGQCLTVTDLDPSITDEQESDNLLDDLHKAAFDALAAIASNTEDLRRKIMLDIHSLTDRIFNALYASVPVQIACLRCLHYVGRSVEQLRTVFMDKPAARQLIQLAQSDNHELACTASAAMCNLLLEFSPCKFTLVDCGCVDTLAQLVASEDPSLRLNGVWGLMNLSYKTEDKIRSALLRSFTPADALRSLTEMSNESLAVTRLMNFLRNLIYDKDFTDNLIPTYGNSIVQCVIFVLEGDYKAENKEQALSVLVNLSNSPLGKEYIISNEDIRNKIFNYVNYHPYPPFQITAASAICNLLCIDDSGARERQKILKEFGVGKMLHQIKNATRDPHLMEKIKLALEYLSS